MGNKIGVLTVHGLGTQTWGYSATWARGIRNKLHGSKVAIEWRDA